MARTAPYVALRLAVYFGIAGAIVIVTGASAMIGYGIGSLGGEDFRTASGFWGGAAGFGLSAGLIYLAREYILYLVKAGHIAVLVDLMDGREDSGNAGQIARGTRIVREHFVEASVLFGIDQVVKAVINAVTSLMAGTATFLPIPSLDTLARMLRLFLKIAVGFIDEVILAYAIHIQTRNPWQAAEEALILYCQNYKVMIRNAAWVAMFIYVFAFVVFLLALAPASALIYLFPGGWSAGGFVFALLFAWAVKAAVLEPLAIACMMQVFFRTTAGQEPDPEWQARLAQLSGRFGMLAERARDWSRQPAAPQERKAAV